MSLIGKGYNRALSQEDEKRVIKIGIILAVAAFLFMSGFALFVHYDIVKLHPPSMSTEMVKGYAGRVELALRYQTLLVLWLMFNVMVIIYYRLTTKALNPLDERTEQRIQLFKNILTNSFETIIISVFSQLIFVSFATPATILKFIPLVNVIQFVGRATFYAGYPLFRSFGFVCTIFPNILMTAYNVYKFGSFIGAY